MIIVHDADGRISTIVSEPVPPGTSAYYTELGIAHIETNEPKPAHEIAAGFHVSGGQLVERPVFDLPEQVEIVANGIDEAVLPNLPDPCLANIDGVETVIDGGQLVIASDMPAIYTIELIRWPYIPHTVKVIANAPVAQ